MCIAVCFQLNKLTMIESILITPFAINYSSIKVDEVSMDTQCTLQLPMQLHSLIMDRVSVAISQDD